MRAAIVREPLHPVALLAEVGSTANGASVLFVGTVREVNDGRPVTGIEYSGYVAMAERELRSIVEEAATRFGTPHIVAVHRIGTLALGEASVVIAAAHRHRAAAFEAARYIIEEIKTRVPVWKLEHYADGAREWIDPTRGRVEVAP